MNDIIAEALESFDLDNYRPIYPRDLDLGDPLVPRTGNLVKVVTGMRRSGKSYRIFQEMSRLLADGVPQERICYFNFEDERLAPITTHTGDEVLEAFYLNNPDAYEQGAYLFFDELQEMDNWGAWLRRIVDTHKATIYVTRSSSAMLSSEISTEFRGRAIDFELLPYSLRELAGIRHPEIDLAQGVHSHADDAKLQNLLSGYLERGGFPAVQDLPATQATALLQSYAQRVVSRDVVERRNVPRARVASLLAQRLLSSNSKSYSLRKIEGDLRSAGIRTSRDMLGGMVSYMEDANLLFTVRRFSYALSESSTSTPKIYAVDPGLALAMGKANSNELGQRLENVVYLELRRRNAGSRRESICSYQTQRGHEVDFVVGDALFGEAYSLFQVCADISDKRTLQREERALWEALDETGLNEGVLITGEGRSDMREREGKRILQVPAREWLLQKENTG